MVLGHDGSLAQLAGALHYCKGVAVTPDGTLVVVESRGLQAVLPARSREWSSRPSGPGGGDPFCLDVDGRDHTASATDHGVWVVDVDGSAVDLLSIEGRGLTTNCCFGGDDLRRSSPPTRSPGASSLSIGCRRPRLRCSLCPTWTYAHQTCVAPASGHTSKATPEATLYIGGR